jgi:4-amino-4-deoxy-L-arabinose transferase-like glycosyltransferase
MRLRPLTFALLLFAAAFALRLALVLSLRDLHTGPEGIASADDVEFNRLALGLAAGRGYLDDRAVPTSFRAPGWPLLLALVYAAFGPSYPAVYLLLCGLGALGCVLAYFLAREFLPEGPARLAGALGAVYLPHAYFSCSFLSEALFVPLLTLGVWLFVRHLKRPSLLLLGLSGLVLGYATLTRPFALLLLPILGCLLAVAARRRGVWIIPGLVFAAAFALPVVPWTLRNQAVHGRFVLVATNGGSTFYGGNNGRVVREWRQLGGWISTTDLPHRDLIVATPDEVSHDKMEWRLGLDWLRDNWYFAPLLLAAKTGRLCLWLPDFDGGSPVFFAARLAGWVPFLVLFLCGAWACLRDRSLRGPAWLALHASLLATLATAWIFWGSPRFRDANAGLLMIYAALGARLLGLRLAGRLATRAEKASARPMATVPS